MKHITLLSSLFLALAANSQKFIVQSGASFVAKGTPTIELNNMSLDAAIAATDLQNANLVMRGNKDCSLKNSAATLNLQTLTVDKPGATLTLAGDVQVSKGVQMANGLLDMTSKHLYLSGNAAISGETPTARITSSSDGYIQAVVNLTGSNNLNVGGMGVYITTAANAGQVTVRRGHKVQSGNGLSGGIHRYYDFSPSGTALNATLKFTYFDAELNGQMEAGLHLFESTNNGSSWSNKQTPNKDAVANYVVASGLNGLHRYTLGAAAGATLPVAGLELQAKRLSTQQVMLTWKTVQENDNAGFAIERKQEGENSFVQRTFVQTKASGGNSNTVLSYETTDANAFGGKTYYRIRQNDLAGNITYSDIKVVEGSGGRELAFSVWPVPSAGNVYVKADGIDRETLYLLDANGRLVKEFSIECGQTFTLAGLSPGTYFIQFPNKKEAAKKIIVQ